MITPRPRRAICILVLALLGPLLGLAAGPAALERFEFSEPHMGTHCRLVLYADSHAAAATAATAAFARLRELDLKLSDYKDDSELMRLCKQPAGTPQPVSPELFTVLEIGQEIAEQSGGAFDVTIGPLAQIWRRARRQARLPDASLITQARQRVGFRLLQLDRAARTATLARSDMRLDLGGIAKGYAADELLAVISAASWPRAMIVLGGEVVAGEPPLDAKGWKVEIAAVPGPPMESDVSPTFLLLARAAVSTSGDAEQYVLLDGERYSHVVDPRTGWALRASPQVTVVARKGIWADALATAASVLETSAAVRLIEQHAPAAGLLRRPTPDTRWEETATPGWSDLLRR
ncbi:MAG TPA: FAD:protein FMN transferase [Gemmatales bacterium]|nr:FAD:protein FMN transferase [Gemmatales bacterium]